MRSEQLKNRFMAIMQASHGVDESHHISSPEIEQHLAKLNYEVGQINHCWNISPEFEITSHRPKIGKWIVLGKKVVRKFLRWYINPPFNMQRGFNANVVRSLNALTHIANNLISEVKEYRELDAKINRLNEKIDELVNKLSDEINRLQDRQNVLYNQHTNSLREMELEIKQQIDKFQQQLEQLVKVIHLNTSSGRMNAIDYIRFEQKFRGSREVIKERQKFYLPYFTGKENVLDIGSGRGEFIELLLENGIKVKGIDVNKDMVEYCQSLGLDVTHGDAIEYLSALDDNTLDGVFMAQVIEHLSTNIQLELIDLVYKKLKPGGVFIIETINVRSVFAMSNWFYMDPTHVKPVHPETLKFFMQGYGFSKVELQYLSPVEDRKIEQLHIEGADTSGFNRSMEQLQELIYGYQEYAVIVYK